MEYLIRGIEEGMVRNKKVTREFIYSSEKACVPIERLHEHLNVFLEEDYISSKAPYTVKNYRAYLKRWIRWVYDCENIPLPEAMKPREQMKPEIEEVMEVQYEYKVPTLEVEPDNEYLDFLRRYEKVKEK